MNGIFNTYVVQNVVITYKQDLLSIWRIPFVCFEKSIDHSNSSDPEVSSGDITTRKVRNKVVFTRLPRMSKIIQIQRYMQILQCEPAKTQCNVSQLFIYVQFTKL